MGGYGLDLDRRVFPYVQLERYGRAQLRHTFRFYSGALGCCVVLDVRGSIYQNQLDSGIHELTRGLSTFLTYSDQFWAKLGNSKDAFLMENWMKLLILGLIGSFSILNTISTPMASACNRGYWGKDRLRRGYIVWANIDGNFR